MAFWPTIWSWICSVTSQTRGGEPAGDQGEHRHHAVIRHKKGKTSSGDDGQDADESVLHDWDHRGEFATDRPARIQGVLITARYWICSVTSQTRGGEPWPDRMPESNRLSVPNWVTCPVHPVILIGGGVREEADGVPGAGQ